jgi:hypothetical protein
MQEPAPLFFSFNRCQRRNRSKDWAREKEVAERLHGLERERKVTVWQWLCEERGVELPKPDPPPKQENAACVQPEARPCCKHGHPMPLDPGICGDELLIESETLEVKKAYRLLDKLRPISRNRTARCRRFRLHKTVQVMSDGERSWVSGVQTCNNVWGCPVCASQIQRERAALVDYAIDRWISYGPSRKGPPTARAYMLTLTVKHAISHRLKQTSKLVADAWSDLFAGREGQETKERLRIEHFVRALEPTYGTENGWHPHLHCILLTDGELDAEAFAYLQERWRESVMRAGLDGDGYHAEFEPSETHGVKLREIFQARDGRYVSKLFLELTNYETKEGKNGNLTWWRVAELAGDGDPRMIAVWQEAQDALFGRKQLTWSQKTADFFGIKDLVEEDIDHPDGVQAEDIREVFQLEIPGRVWDEAWRRDRYFLSTLLPSVTQAASTGDWGALLALLSAELSRVGGGATCSPVPRELCALPASQVAKLASVMCSEADAVRAVSSCVS